MPDLTTSNLPNSPITIDRNRIYEGSKSSNTLEVPVLTILAVQKFVRHSDNKIITAINNISGRDTWKVQNRTPTISPSNLYSKYCFGVDKRRDPPRGRLSQHFSGNRGKPAVLFRGNNHPPRLACIRTSLELLFFH